MEIDPEVTPLGHDVRARGPAPSSTDWEERLRRLLSWASVVAVICYGILLFVLFLVGGFREPPIKELAE